MNWTSEQAKAYMQRRMKDEARARERMQTNAKNNNPHEGVRAVEPECTERRTLDGAPSGETKGGTGVTSRFAIRFIVRSRRPLDWDNTSGGSLKRLQDLLVAPTGIIPGDGWNVLEGHIASTKADSAEDEGTTVIIETI